MSSNIASKSIMRQREKILRYTLWATAVLASIAYVPSVAIAIQLQLWMLILVDTLAWIAVLILALWKTLPFKIKAVAFISNWTLFSFFLLWLVGPIGAGVAWLMVTPVMSALFFGYRGAVFSSIAMLLILVFYGILLQFHTPETSLFPFEPYDVLSWFGVSGSLLFLSMLSSLAIAQLLKGTEESLVDLEASRRQLAKALTEQKQLQEQLSHSQKLSALGTLSSGIAHDFNNLLSPILISSEEMRELLPTDSVEHKQIDTIIQSAERARNLVRRILSFSHNVSTDPYALEVAPVLREGVALLRSSTSANIEMSCQVLAEDACILADPDSLMQIVMNLGTNACSAMGAAGGILEFKLYRSANEASIVLEVKDSGSGIPDSIRDQIFDPFFTTREPGKGTGLGLSIVHKLVTTFSGKISLVSEPGKGTCFTLEFPEVKKVKDHVPDVQLVADTQQQKKLPRSISILILDDEEMVRSTLRSVLVREGFNVTDTGNPSFALRQIKESPESADILITDFAMPGMTGLEVVEKLRESNPELPVLLVSGYLTIEQLDRVAALDIAGVLSKPFNRAAILERIYKLVTERKIGA